MLYADDICLTSNQPQQLQAMLDRLRVYAQWRGLVTNVTMRQSLRSFLQVLRHAQHNLQIPEHASNKFISPYFFPDNFSKRSRLTSSRPDAILATPYQAKLTYPSSSSSFSSQQLFIQVPSGKGSLPSCQLQED
eukprot:1146865-Pelagomonas_calceolata.AAC.9